MPNEQGRIKNINIYLIKLLLVVLMSLSLSEFVLATDVKTGELNEPTILEPKVIPNNGDNFLMKFKDVGADHYKISAHFCLPYNNDGINPCMNSLLPDYSTNFDIFRKNRELIVDNSIAGTPNTRNVPNLFLKNGIIELRSNIPIKIPTYSDSVEYSVNASTTKTGSDGKKIFLNSKSNITFRLHLPKPLSKNNFNSVDYIKPISIILFIVFILLFSFLKWKKYQVDDKPKLFSILAVIHTLILLFFLYLSFNGGHSGRGSIDEWLFVFQSGSSFSKDFIHWTFLCWLLLLTVLTIQMWVSLAKKNIRRSYIILMIVFLMTCPLIALILFQAPDLGTVF